MWHNTLFITLYLFRNLRLRIAMVCSAWRQLYISKHTSSTISCDLVLKIFLNVPYRYCTMLTPQALFLSDLKVSETTELAASVNFYKVIPAQYAMLAWAPVARCLSMYVLQKSEFYWIGWTDRAGFVAWGLPSTYNTIPSRGFIYDSW